MINMINMVKMNKMFNIFSLKDIVIEDMAIEDISKKDINIKDNIKDKDTYKKQIAIKELNKYLIAFFIFVIFLFFSNTKLFAGTMFSGQYFDSNSNLDLNSSGSIKSLRNFDFTLYDSLVNKELSIVIAIHSMLEDNGVVPKTVNELITKGYLPNSFNDSNLINSNKITFKIDKDNNVVIVNSNIQDSEIPVYFKEYYLNNTYNESSSFNNINFFKTQFIENNTLKTKYYLTRKAINILETKDTLTNNPFGIGGSGSGGGSGSSISRTYIGNKEPSSYDNSIPNNSIWYDSNSKEFELKKRINNQWSDIYSSNKNIDSNGRFVNPNPLSIVAVIKNFENVTITEETKNIVCRTSGATYNQQTNRCEAFTSDACDGNYYDIKSNKCYITADSYCRNNGYSGYDSSSNRCVRFVSKEAHSRIVDYEIKLRRRDNPLECCQHRFGDTAIGGSFVWDDWGYAMYCTLTDFDNAKDRYGEFYGKYFYKYCFGSPNEDYGWPKVTPENPATCYYHGPEYTLACLINDCSSGVGFSKKTDCVDWIDSCPSGMKGSKIHQYYRGILVSFIYKCEDGTATVIDRKCPKGYTEAIGSERWFGECKSTTSPYSNIPTTYNGYTFVNNGINGTDVYVKTPSCNGKRMTVSPYSPTPHYGNNGICYSDIGLYCKTYASSVNIIQMPNGKQVTCWDRTQNCADNRFNLVYDYSGIQDKCNKYNYSCNNKSLYGLAEHPTFNNATDLFNRIKNKDDKALLHIDKIAKKENIILNDNNGAMCVENRESIYNSIPKDYTIDNKVKTGF